MQKLHNLKEEEIFDLLEYILPNKDNSVFSSEKTKKYDKYDYGVYEDLSELIIKNAMRQGKVIIEENTFACYFSYNKKIYMLQVTYDINYGFHYEKVKNPDILTKEIVNLNKLLKNLISIKNKHEELPFSDYIVFSN